MVPFPATVDPFCCIVRTNVWQAELPRQVPATVLSTSGSKLAQAASVAESDDGEETAHRTSGV
jgi:hypothetical protein